MKIGGVNGKLKVLDETVSSEEVLAMFCPYDKSSEEFVTGDAEENDCRALCANIYGVIGIKKLVVPCVPPTVKIILIIQHPALRKKEGVSSEFERCNTGNLGTTEVTVKKSEVKNETISLHATILAATQKHLKSHAGDVSVYPDGPASKILLVVEKSGGYGKVVWSSADIRSLPTFKQCLETDSNDQIKLLVDMMGKTDDREDDEDEEEYDESLDEPFKDLTKAARDSLLRKYSCDPLGSEKQQKRKNSRKKEAKALALHGLFQAFEVAKAWPSFWEENPSANKYSGEPGKKMPKLRR